MSVPIYWSTMTYKTLYPTWAWGRCARVGRKREGDANMALKARAGAGPKMAAGVAEAAGA